MSHSFNRTVAEEYSHLVGHTRRDTEPMVYVGRGPDSRDMREAEIGERGWLGNPFALSDGYSREESVALFEEEFAAKLRNDPKFAGAVAGLAGRRLSCWCQTLDEVDGDLCHALVIAKWADQLAIMAND